MLTFHDLEDHGPHDHKKPVLDHGPANGFDRGRSKLAFRGRADHGLDAHKKLVLYHGPADAFRTMVIFFYFKGNIE
jgi:hypothetical protein